MKTAQLFRKKAFDKILIFVSSSREYVFEAYDVEAKKLRATDRPMTTPLFLLRCVQLGISIRDLDLLTIGISSGEIYHCRRK